MSDFDIDDLAQRIDQVCIKKGWNKDWIKGGCYIHLEVSEFIESLRGKGEDPPEDEAADVLFALFAVLANYGIDPSDVLDNLDRKTKEHEDMLR